MSTDKIVNILSQNSNISNLSGIPDAGDQELPCQISRLKAHNPEAIEESSSENFLTFAGSTGVSHKFNEKRLSLGNRDQLLLKCKSVIDELHRELSEERSMRKFFEKKADEQERSFSGKEADSKDLELKNSELARKLAERDEELSREKEKHASLIAAKDREIGEHLSINKRLQEDLDEVKMRVLPMSEKINGLERELETKRSTWREELFFTKRDQEGDKRKIEELQEELAKRDDLLCEWNETLESLDKKMREMENEIEDLKSKLAREKIINEEQSFQISEVEREKQQVKERLESVRQEKVKSETHLRSQIDELNSGLDRMVKEYDSLLKEKEKKLGDDLLRCEEELKQERMSAAESKAELSKIISKLERTLQENNEQLFNLKRISKEQKEKAKLLSVEIEKSNREREKAVDHYSKLLAEMETCKNNEIKRQEAIIKEQGQLIGNYERMLKKQREESERKIEELLQEIVRISDQNLELSKRNLQIASKSRKREEDHVAPAFLNIKENSEINERTVKQMGKQVRKRGASDTYNSNIRSMNPKDASFEKQQSASFKAGPFFVQGFEDEEFEEHIDSRLNEITREIEFERNKREAAEKLNSKLNSKLKKLEERFKNDSKILKTEVKGKRDHSLRVTSRAMPDSCSPRQRAYLNKTTQGISQGGPNLNNVTHPIRRSLGKGEFEAIKKRHVRENTTSYAIGFSDRHKEDVFELSPLLIREKSKRPRSREGRGRKSSSNNSINAGKKNDLSFDTKAEPQVQRNKGSSIGPNDGLNDSVLGSASRGNSNLHGEFMNRFKKVISRLENRLEKITNEMSGSETRRDFYK